MQWIVGVALAGLMATSAMAADAVLRTGSQEAYEASVVELARPLGAAAGRSLFLDLGTLAAGPNKGEGPYFDHMVAETEEMKRIPGELLRRLAPYEGKTAAEITALAAEMRKQ